MQLIDRGILLLATSWPLYGKAAANLAMSIKSMSPNMPIALAHDAAAISHLSDDQRRFFDILIPFEVKGFAGKLHLDLITPFKKTLFLDADMAWMPQHPPETLFYHLRGSQFSGITEGYYDASTASDAEVNGAYYFWAGIEEIISRYKIKGRIYQWRSEAMYFTNAPRVKAMFKRARSIYSNPKLESAKLFGQQIPDELALNIACAIHDLHPHEYKWTPAYWPKMHGERVPDFEEIYNQYYLMSAGGHTNSPAAQNLYNRLVRVAANKLGGHVTVFPLMNKSTSITDRATF